MVFHKSWVVILVVIGLAGCSTTQKAIYKEGYTQGVKEQMEQIASQFQGGSFPYYHWTSPIVQEVRIPAHLTNGVMIPEHNELVIIKPGEWTISPAYPIQTQEKSNEDIKDSNRNMDVANITALPKSSGTAAEGLVGDGAGPNRLRGMEDAGGE